jgi:hypothetical protein
LALMSHIKITSLMIKCAKLPPHITASGVRAKIRHGISSEASLLPRHSDFINEIKSHSTR